MKKGENSKGKVSKIEEKTKRRESRGIETGCWNVKVLPFLRFNLMICSHQNVISRSQANFSEAREKIQSVPNKLPTFKLK